MTLRLALLACTASVLALPAVEVRLTVPLTTTVDLVAEFPAGDTRLTAELVVPADAPRDLQVGAFANEDGGGWRQSIAFVPLTPGRHRLAWMVPGSADPAMRAIGGLLFCSPSPPSSPAQGGSLRIEDVQVEPVTLPGDRVLHELAWEGAAGADRAQAETGRPWRLSLRPGRQAGFALAALVTTPDGAAIRLEAAPPAAGGSWSLAFTPMQPGIHRVQLEGSWGGERVGHALELTAIGPAPAPQDRRPQPASKAGDLVLAAPLRTCRGLPLAEASAACRVSARLAVPADAPDDLVAAAYVRDGVGRWRQSSGVVALRPGEQAIDLAVPAGAVEAGSGEAGLALWSARISSAALGVRDLRVEPLGGATGGEPCLDRLRLEGVVLADGGMTAAVGGVWSASVVPEPASGAVVAARIIDASGRVGVVPAVVGESGRHRLAFHPVLPGSCRVELLATWPDGRRLACQLPRLTVTGGHPCPAGQVLHLRAPLATILPLTSIPPATAGRLTAMVLVPDGAPADLAVALAAVDHHDRWFESRRRQALRPGINRIDLRLDAEAALAAGPGEGVWNGHALDRHERTALVFTSAQPGALPLTVGGVRLEPAPDTSRAPRLLALAAVPEGRTGERWSLTLRPEPFPANPFDPDEFHLDLLVTTPEGRQLQVPGFYAEDMRAEDRGDRERLLPLGSGRFEVRYRPRTPGRHELTLQASWGGGRSLRCAVPPLDVAGPPWDGYVRIDGKDPRFFAVDGRFHWPSGPNLRSVWDLRSRERMRTRLTPDRGSLAYQAYLQRFAAGGANACEIWLSAWNLALEWRRDWPGYDGVGRYSQQNAWRLDRILDAAWAAGMRVNLVVNNHGQASDRTDAEWANNPYNRAVGGQLTAPAQMFEAPYALRGQERLRRYLIGRYADHPAVLGWKLWTEMNLTNGKRLLHPWHAQAVPRWRELDPYGHPVTSHWSGDYRTPDRAIARLLDYVCIDAYHDDKPDNPYRLVHRLLRDSTLGEPRGLAALGRPVLVTEYGGNWSGTRTDALMQVDHATGAWAAFVSGHAGAPMLWWFEWIDQGGHFAPYGAIARFIAGEDLRVDGRPSGVQATASVRLWAAAWRTRTRLFGYAIDERWAADGTSARQVQAEITLDEPWPAGRLLCEWWDPERGAVLSRQTLDHPGGTLRLAPPRFARHLAWKVLVQP